MRGHLPRGPEGQETDFYYSDWGRDAVKNLQTQGAVGGIGRRVHGGLGDEVRRIIRTAAGMETEHPLQVQVLYSPTTLSTPQCSSGTSQSRPFPARPVKIMESAGQYTHMNGAGGVRISVEAERKSLPERTALDLCLDGNLKPCVGRTTAANHGMIETRLADYQFQTPFLV